MDASTTTRTLKIEADGDAWKGGIKPKILLTGRWLEQAGFKPGNHVQVMLLAPGIIELRFRDASSAHEIQSVMQEETECPF